jgi:hypothetical protein
MIATAKRIALFAGFLVTFANAHATDSWVSVGKAPTSDGGGTSLAIGFKGPNSNFGFSLGVILNSEFDSSNLQDYPVPHSNYQSIGVKRVGNSYGLDALYFISASDTVRPYIGVGIYTNQRKEIARSNATGWYYNQGNKAEVSLAGELGLQAVTAGGFIFGVGYHTLRGANISIGKSF